MRGVRREAATLALFAMQRARNKPKRNLATGLAVAVCSAGLCCVTAFLAPGTAAVSPQESHTNTRLLNAEQGREIVRVAEEHERPARGTRDCSHLVHEIYALAGFEYPYASSFDLYAGSENFERVRTAQPGDLIVWPGHAGIVFDATQHSFYSLLRSGLQVEDYQAAYWKSRGKPRFLRYVIAKSGSVEAAAERRASRAVARGKHGSTEATLEERTDSESSMARRSATETSERTAVFGPPLAAKPREIPASILIAEGRKPPTNDEVEAAISELSSAAGNVLRTNEPLMLGTPVVIYDLLAIERVEIKHDHGWAHLQVDFRVTVAGASTDLQKRSEKVHWELRRTKSGWQAVAPLDRTYVPRDVAVRVLAGQLAQLTQSDGAAKHSDTVMREEAELAKVLNALLEEKLGE
jgi:hypothetical protein